METMKNFRQRAEASTGGVAYDAIPRGTPQDLLGGKILCRRGRVTVVTHGYPDLPDEEFSPKPENFRLVGEGHLDVPLDTTRSVSVDWEGVARSLRKGDRAALLLWWKALNAAAEENLLFAHYWSRPGRSDVQHAAAEDALKRALGCQKEAGIISAFLGVISE